MVKGAHRETPQGGVDDLIKRFERRAPKLTPYADDIGLNFTGVCPSTLSSIIVPTLREVCEWAE